jgi:hypothetical protein
VAAALPVSVEVGETIFDSSSVLDVRRAEIVLAPSTQGRGGLVQDRRRLQFAHDVGRPDHIGLLGAHANVPFCVADALGFAGNIERRWPPACQIGVNENAIAARLRRVVAV